MYGALFPQACALRSGHVRVWNSFVPVAHLSQLRSAKVLQTQMPEHEMPETWMYAVGILETEGQRWAPSIEHT